MNIKGLVEELVQKHGTNDPFRIAKELRIQILYEDLGGTAGYYSKDFRLKFIHINKNLPDSGQRFVCGHELGHAIQHPNKSTPFLIKYTVYPISQIEREANTFAVELLLPDSYLREYPNCNVYHLARFQGIPQALVGLKTLPD